MSANLQSLPTEQRNMLAVVLCCIASLQFLYCLCAAMAVVHLASAGKVMRLSGG